MSQFSLSTFEFYPNLGRDGIEGFWVMDGNLRETLAIQRDTSPLEPVDKLAVAQPSHLGSGGEPGNPQAPKFTFLVASIAVREHARPEQGFFG